MSYTFRPAVMEQTPVIVGLAGPSKSGKTYSALRLATGMANGGKIIMINTEGPRGHQYANKFTYIACDLTEPFSMKKYEGAIKAATQEKPTVLIIDSMSHAHEGIGGMLDQHEVELDRMAGKDYKKRDRMTWAAWVKPKADEAQMINAMLQQECHIILCFRAKEKIKIVSGQQPQDLGWRPIASDRIHFETAFTVILPPNGKGIPDLSQTGSEFREPFDTMIKNNQISESLGVKIAQWAKGDITKKPTTEEPPPQAGPEPSGAAPSSSTIDPAHELCVTERKCERFRTCDNKKITTARGLCEAWQEKPEDLPTEAFPTKPISEKQLKKLSVMLKNAGVTDKEGFKATISQYISRTVESRKELTLDEASAIISGMSNPPEKEPF